MGETRPFYVWAVEAKDRGEPFVVDPIFASGEIEAAEQAVQDWQHDGIWDSWTPDGPGEKCMGSVWVCRSANPSEEGVKVSIFVRLEPHTRGIAG